VSSLVFLQTILPLIANLFFNISELGVLQGRLGIYFTHMYVFEFNDEKSALNLKKHGIDFIKPQLLWDDPNFIEIQATSNIEPRALIVGKISNKHFSAIITCRKDKVRIISVRRSRKADVELYEN